MSKRKNTTGIPDFEIESLARSILPVIQKLFESEDNRKEYEKWLAESKANKILKKEHSG